LEDKLRLVDLCVDDDIAVDDTGLRDTSIDFLRKCFVNMVILFLKCMYLALESCNFNYIMIIQHIHVVNDVSLTCFVIELN